MALSLESSVFHNGDTIPDRYTCEGDDVAPPLHWTGIPSDARSLVLIVEDPDAPDPRHPRTTFTHWIVYNIPPSADDIPEGGTLPKNARTGVNDWQRRDYGGPCPPIGRHRYVHRLFALDTMLNFDQAPTRAQVLQAMDGHVLAEAQLIGTYEKRPQH